MAKFLVNGEHYTLADGEHLYWVDVTEIATDNGDVWLVVAPTLTKAVTSVLRQYKAGEVVLESARQDDGYICHICGLVGGH